MATQFGATAVVNSEDGRAPQRVMALTGGAGVDVAIEAVGVPGHLRHLPRRLSRQGDESPTSASMASRSSCTFERLWDRNITLTTRLVDTVTTPSMLLKVVQSGKLPSPASW